jgi:hypothetical protein
MIWKSKRSGLLGAAIALSVAAAGCSEDSPPVTVRNLDRPSAVAFACYGDMRVTEEGDSQGDTRVSAQPLASCESWSNGEVPEGQEDLLAPKVFGFVLQSSRGTVAVVDSETQTVLDSDPLTPGKNAIPIGTLPIAMTGDASGCYMVAASAASCDLSVLDVTSALDLRAAARISRVAITNAGGEPMLAKPRTLIGGPAEQTVGLECPAQATGVAYVAYPACHLVAAVDMATGVIQAGIQFAEDGTATLTDGAVSCPQECGSGSITGSSTAALGGPDIDAGPPDAGPPDGGAPDAGPSPPDAGPPTTDDSAPRPVVTHMGTDGRLYLASENSPIITAVTLDESGLPVADGVLTVQLDGPVGVTSLAVSDEVINGGEGRQPGGGGGTNRFLYAIATDRTVRVVNVETMVECDTQVDPRYIHDVRDLSLMSCFPVNGPETPQRRATAISPGIHLPGDETPLDVAFAELTAMAPAEQPEPLNMAGTFAFVTSTRGSVFVINVDDDVYPDFEDTADLAAVSMPLALAHQLRDVGTQRNGAAGSCAAASADGLALGPRASDNPTRLYSTGRIAPEKLHLTPSVRQVECVFEDESVPVSELAFAAPPLQRETAFPDWAAVRDVEQWSFVYEGVLSRDGPLSDIDGPPVRSGTIDVNGFEIALIDPSDSLCQMGAEPLDLVQLIGCDPSVGDLQCGLGETCFVHPETPSSITTGVCMPSDRTEQLAASCRDFLISRRTYSAERVASDRLMLVPRRRVLRTSPVEGCDSDAQCVQMAQLEQTLTDPQHPVSLGTPIIERDWVCRQDPTRPVAADRCVMACESEDDCEDGNVCLAGYCNEGSPPGQECVQAVQRYQVRASDAFVALGASSGYLHNRIRNPEPVPGSDPEIHECMVDPNASPLMVGRIPLHPPPCNAEGDGFTDISPNPCTITLDQIENFTPYTLQGSNCLERDTELRTRPVTAIRFQNPLFRMHLVDTQTTGDLSCNGDREGVQPPFSTVYTGFEIDFTLVGGLAAMRVPFGTLVPAFPIRIMPAPDGRLWVLDQGDSGQGDAGRIFTLVPTAPAEVFTPAVIR